MNQPLYKVRTVQDTVTVNRVLRNTYTLLGMMFLVGAGSAYIAMQMGWHIGFWPFLIGIFGFSWLVNATRNSAMGLVVAFAFTAFLGIVTGQNLNFTLVRYTNGADIVTYSFILTSVLFFGLSGIAMVTKKDFSGAVKFLSIGTMVVIVAWIGNYFFQIPALALALSSMVVLLACGWILWQTQRIVRGGETNYILAATSLMVNLFALFNNLMALLGVGFGDD